jgi:hypothetical protein
MFVPWNKLGVPAVSKYDNALTFVDIIQSNIDWGCLCMALRARDRGVGAVAGTSISLPGMGHGGKLSASLWARSRLTEMMDMSMVMVERESGRHI